MRPQVLSFTKLQTFSNCHLRYRYAYMERERFPHRPMKRLALPDRIHGALQHFHELARRDGVVPVEALLESWAHIWERDHVENYQSERDFQEGAQILEQYAERENQHPRVPAYMEYPLSWEYGPYKLTAKIDRLDFVEGEKYSLVDYKLDRALPSSPNPAKGNRQLAYYAFLLKKAKGWSLQDVRLYYLRHGKEFVHQPQAREHQATERWIEDTAEAIQKASSRRDTEAWQPVEGKHCHTCPFQKQCPKKTGQALELGEVLRQMTIYDLEEEEAV